jgi:hypothetical protein
VRHGVLDLDDTRGARRTDTTYGTYETYVFAPISPMSPIGPIQSRSPQVLDGTGSFVHHVPSS